MSVYSTGTPFRENIKNFQDETKSLDFSKTDLYLPMSLNNMEDAKENVTFEGPGPVY